MERDLKISHIEWAIIILFIMPFINGIYNRPLVHYPIWYFIVDTIQFIFIPLCILIFLFKNSNLNIEDIGLSIPKSDSDKIKLLLHTVFISVLFLGIYILFHDLFLILYPIEKYIRVVPYSVSKPPPFLSPTLFALYLSLSAGIVEELYYRGLLVLLFKKYKMNNMIIVLVSSCIFSLVHWETGVYNILATFFETVAY